MEPSAEFGAKIEELFAHGGIRAAHRAVDPGHADMPRDASLLEQPRLIVCLGGEASFQRKQGESTGEVRLSPGDGLFVGPGRWVRARPRQRYLSMGVVFYPKTTRYYFMEGKPSRDWRAAGPVKTCVMPIGVGEEARALSRLLAGPPPTLAASNYFRNAFECLLIAVGELLRAPGEAEGVGKARFTWQAACDFISENLQRPLSRKEVARHLAVHPNHLSRLFADFCHEPFSTYLQDRRIERARLLLAEPRLNIAEVAHLSGFTSANYFIRVFRQRTGRTPTQMRVPEK